MVKVLANGDIVPDDDPRAQSSGNRPTVANNQRQGFIYPGNVPVEPRRSVSVFESVNQYLAGIGVPSWPLGPYRVEPVVSLGFLLSLLFGGLRGLLFSGVLFFVLKYSQSGNARDAGINRVRPEAGGGGGSSGTAGWPGGGHRLGR